VLERALAQPDLEVETVDRADHALKRLLEDPPEVLVTDIRMPGIDGLDLMARVREAHPELPVIVMTAHSDLDSAVASYQGGAFEYLPKPFDVDEALALVRHQSDPSIEAIVGSWPARFTNARARQLGFENDKSFREIVEAFLDERA
jgi:DNA-binding NtrC family response regulator